MINSCFCNFRAEKEKPSATRGSPIITKVRMSYNVATVHAHQYTSDALQCRILYSEMSLIQMIVSAIRRALSKFLNDAIGA
jgi:hypothetical protein